MHSCESTDLVLGEVEDKDGIRAVLRVRVLLGCLSLHLFVPFVVGRVATRVRFVAERRGG